MDEWLSALQQYELEPPVGLYTLAMTGKNNSIFSVRSGTQDYILKIFSSTTYDEPESIHYEHRILDWLCDLALPFHLPLPIPNRHGATLSIHSDQTFCLLPRFEGTPPDLTNLTHIAALGQALGQLQTALNQHPPIMRPGRSPFMQFFAFAQQHFDPFSLTPADIGLSASDTDLDHLFAWWRDEAQRLDAFQKNEYKHLPAQISHNDFTPNNVLFHNGAVNAVLDFEFMSVSPRAYDLATILRMTMRIWLNQEPWSILEAFFQGYAPLVTLSESEIAAIPMLMRLRTTMSILWNLGRNKDLERVPTVMQFHFNFVQWLDQHESTFLSVLYETYAN